MARLSALFAAVAALTVAPVQAASFASASLTDFKITLFDLNLSDGVTPGITFDPSPYNPQTIVYAEDSGNSQSKTADTLPADLSVAVGLASARAAITGTGTSPADLTSQTASGSALGPSTRIFASTQILFGFSLTDNTRVSFSGLAKVEATVGEVGFPNTPSTDSGVQTSVFVPSHDGPIFDSVRASVVCCSPGTDSTTRLLNVSITNLTGSNPSGGLLISSLANAAVPVPEPETYAMMVAGLGLLGFMLRRRGRLPRA